MGANEIFQIPLPSPEALQYRAEVVFNWALFSALSLILPLVTLYSGVAAACRVLVSAVTPRVWLRPAVYYVIFSVGLMLVRFPFEWVRAYRIFEKYGLIAQTPGQWMLETLGRGFVDALVYAPLFALGYFILHRSPRRWALWMAIAYVPYAVATAVIYPNVIEPLFSRFTALQAGPLRDEISVMVEREGLHAGSIAIHNQSVRSSELNAYLTGLGKTVRVVLGDNLLSEFEPAEVKHVIAHELGHYRLHHEWISVGWDIAQVVLILALIATVVPFSVRNGGARCGISGVTDVAAIPLVAFWVAAGYLLLEPVGNYIQRAKEREADSRAVAMTGDREACARVTQTLSVGGVPDPLWIDYVVLHTHPLPAHRMATCRGV